MVNKNTINAKENLNITAYENTNGTKQDSKSSSGSIGVTVGAGGLQGINAGYSQSQGNVKENSTTYNESSVTANKDLSFTSGSHTNIQGGKLSGEKVTGSVGGDLNIASKQDGSQYKEQNSSAGLSVGYDFASNQISVGGGANKTNIDSQYSSVTEQSGIYAGEEGFDIRVEKNTDLKGGVIASEAEAEKNKISTGTLTWEDIKNKAEYEIEGKGLGVNVGDEDAPFNERGVTPGLPVTVGDESSSTTKAAIAEGTIEIRDKENQKQDISGLHRDTQNSLNKLGEIFNKKSIEERQELIGLFGEVAYNQIHDMKDLTAVQKTLLHGLVGGIMSKLAGEDMLTGISAAAINKMLIEEIRKAAQDDPAAMQWISVALGTIVDKAVGGSGKVGGAIASSATKNNDTLDAEMAAQGNRTYEEVKKADEMVIFVDNLDTNDIICEFAFRISDDGQVKNVPSSLKNFNFASSVVINGTVAIADLPSDIAKVLKSGKVPGYAGEINYIVAINNDFKNYSGKDLGIAILSDTAGYGIGKGSGALLGASIGANATDNNAIKPVLIIYGGYVGANVAGGVLGDTLSAAIKSKIALSDKEKMEKADE